MGWWNPDPDLATDEHVVWRRSGLMTQRAADGGVLYVTTARLLFVPNRSNLKRNRAPRSWPLVDVESVGIAKPDWTPYTGGMHRRARVTLRSGEALLFSFGHLKTVVEELQALIPGTAPERPNARWE